LIGWACTSTVKATLMSVHVTETFESTAILVDNFAQDYRTLMQSTARFPDPSEWNMASG